MSNSYPGDNNDPPHPSSSSTAFRATRRPSYATVAAGRPIIADNTTATWIEWAQQSRTERIEVGSDMAQTYSHSMEQSPATARGPGSSSNAWATDSVRYDRLSGTPHDGHPAFFTPSYLQSSRHVQRLKQAHEQHLAELQEYAQNNNSSHATAASLSTSSSAANLHKTHAPHRSVIQDVIERLPPPHLASDRLHPLPTAWSPLDKPSGLEILGPYSSEVRFSGVVKHNDDAVAIRSDYPIPKEVGIYYFEVTILSRGKDGLIGIGFSTKKANLSRLPGWETESWAYHGDDGYVFAGNATGKPYGPKFASQDVIGCGINFRTNTAFFTKNGNFLGTAFHNVRQERLHPSVGMKKPGEHLRVNFGRTPFVFDIDRLVSVERTAVLGDIRRTDVSELHPPDDEAALIQNLVGQYLAHEGYVETARAFAADVRERNSALRPESQADDALDDEDVHAVNRQRIRRSILDGDIDRALKYTSAYYPRLFEDDRNKDIYLRLRCQKFVEMMRAYSGQGEGRETDNAPEEEPDTQMELDSQLHRETSMSQPDADLDVDMTTSQSLPAKHPQSSDDLLQSAVQYGTSLQAEFGHDTRPHVQKLLQDMFACLAYVNWEGSPIGYLFDTSRRGVVGEGVNGAILVSLGKPSSAALEKVVAQTEALLEETAGRNGGGGSALIVVKRECLGP